MALFLVGLVVSRKLLARQVYCYAEGAFVEVECDFAGCLSSCRVLPFRTDLVLQTVGWEDPC